MDLTAIQAEVAARGFDFDSATRLNFWINDAYARICEREAWPFLETTASGPAPLSVADLRAVVSVVDSTNAAVLFPEDYRTLRDLDPTLIATGVPQSWYLSSPTVLATYPTSTTALSVRYIKVPAELSAGSDVPVIPTRFHYAIVEGAVAHAYRDSDNAEMAQNCDERFEAAIDRMADSLLAVNYDYPMSSVVMGSTDW